MNKKVLICSVIILILIATAGYFIFRKDSIILQQNLPEKKDLVSQNQYPSSPKTENCFTGKSLVSSSDTSSWKEYRGQHFSIKYPNFLTIEESEEKNGKEYIIREMKTNNIATLNVSYPLEESFKIESKYISSIVYEVLSNTWWNYEGYNELDKTNIRTCVPNSATVTINNKYPIYHYSDYGQPFYIVLMRNITESQKGVYYKPTIITLSVGEPAIEGEESNSTASDEDTSTQFRILLENMLRTINSLPASRG